MKYRTLFLALGLIFPTWAYAQVSAIREATVSGSFDSNSVYYMADDGVKSPDNCIGSNNYGRINISMDAFSAGLQWEAYLPVLQGFPSGYNKSKITSRYLSYTKNGFNARIGDFYEQFGSGLLFRSWEDRDLGINTAMEGFKIEYSYKDLISFCIINGRPRIFMDYSSSLFRGIDGRLSLSDLIGCDSFDLYAEGSYVSRYQSVNPEDYDLSSQIKSAVDGYSARIGAAFRGIGIKAEYVRRDADPMNMNAMSMRRSEALLIESSFAGKNTGITASFRTMSNMSIYNERESADGMYALMNYTPSLTQQYTYTLACLNPYSSHTEEETGGQLDIFHTFPRNSVLGGKRGIKVHFNASAWFGPEFYTEGNTVLYYRDLSCDIDKSLSKNLKLKALYSFQTNNPILKGLYGQDLWKSHITVADIFFKLDKSHSLRAEIQHLLSTSDSSELKGSDNIKYCSNWLSALAEYYMAPRWSLYAQDSWNYNGTGRHFFNGGMSYSDGGVRLELALGRYMQGYICSGGICRLVPAYTGASLKFSLLL